MSPYREPSLHIDTSPSRDRWRRVRVVEANYGRDEGWFVEARGLRVGELTDVQWHDMFWDSYLFTPTTTESSMLAWLADDASWRRCELEFRTRSTGFLAPHAFASNAPRNGRILLRGLYVAPNLSMMEHLHLATRRAARAAKTLSSKLRA